MTVDPQLIVKALDGRWHGTYGMARCPAHEDRSPSLAVRSSAGRTLVHCHAGCSQADVIAALRRLGLWAQQDDQEPPPRRRPVYRDDAGEKARIAAAGELWRAAQPIEDTPAEAYLEGRGLRGPFPGTLRYHGHCLHAATGLHLPAMIAAVSIWPAHEIAGVHRTYITTDGRAKAGVSSPKMMLGRIAGGAVRLAPVKDRLAIAEGIETALAFQQATGIPTWAVMSASNLPTVQIPTLVREVVIACDGDPAGRKAAEEAKARFLSLERAVRIVDPGDGRDFNDYVQSGPQCPIQEAS